MDEARGSSVQTAERRRARRGWVAGVAVLQSGSQAPSVWCIANLSPGGASLVGEGSLLAGRLSVSLHVAGFPDVDLEASLVRRQLTARAGRCAVRFVDLSSEQQRALREILGADHPPAPDRRRALLVRGDDSDPPPLAAELAALGLEVRNETSIGQAAAWLQRESAEILVVDRRVLEIDRWGLLQFARATAPAMRRFVLAEDVRGFRLYFALKAGLVEGLVEPDMRRDLLARQLFG